MKIKIRFKSNNERTHLISLVSIVFILCYFNNVIAQEIITRISINATGVGGNEQSRSPALSADGRYLTFHSEANNLVADDTNGFSDVFVYDRQTKQLKRVSVAMTGTEANFISTFPSLSADGRYIVFQSDASNLVANDTNYATDIFVYDQTTGQTHPMSINHQGELGNASSTEPVISADGRYVAFQSTANNLVKADKNNRLDIFVHDRNTGETSLVSVNSKGKQARKGISFGAAISATGRYVAFSSAANNLITQDTNGVVDVFVHDRETGETVCVSVNSQGELGDGDSFSATISADGRYVAFQSRATNLVAEDTNQFEDIFLHDLNTGETQRISMSNTRQQGDEMSFAPTLSADGRYILFNSDANNLVLDDTNDSTDVFIYDQQTKQTQQLTLKNQYEGIRASSHPPSISEDGRWVAFESKSANLVTGDFNRTVDIFLYDRGYYASYNAITRQLFIPVLTVANLGLFQATLALTGTSESIQFTLDEYTDVNLPLEDIPSTYKPATYLLHLPKIEVINPPHEIILCEAQMVTDFQLTFFTVTEQNCY